MERHRLSLEVLPGRYAVCQLAAEVVMPEWAVGEFVSVSRTAEELSVVCREEGVPEGVRCERGWRCLRVAGELDFGLVGVLASLVVPLGEAGVAVFCVSTFATDYLLVKEVDAAKALGVLQGVGHAVTEVGYPS